MSGGADGTWETWSDGKILEMGISFGPLGVLKSGMGLSVGDEGNGGDKGDPPGCEAGWGDEVSTEASTGMGVGDNDASREGLEVAKSIGSGTGLAGGVDTGSSTGGDGGDEESAKTWDESAESIDSGRLEPEERLAESADCIGESARMVESGSMGTEDEGTEMFETGSGAGVGLSVGRADMVESGSIGSVETGSCVTGGIELTG